jgi:ABC-2 type transport system ATP-binding protein
LVYPVLAVCPMPGVGCRERLSAMIEVDRLTKAYGKHLAVDDVSFRVEPGTVTGFLGPNGAGKSTTMRMMVGLTPPTAGGSTILGVPYSKIPNPGTHVGVLLDASAQHAGRTGREVLHLGAMLMGLEERRVDEMLELVGLSDVEAKRRVGNYSLGMRQRLGIAHALLGDPQVLVLDEPANGLDPAGIRWMRGLLRGFAERGGTVLLSSHLLHEIEMIADELVVIGRGKIVAQGSKDELVSASGTLVRSLDLDTLAVALKQAELSFTHTATSSLIVQATGEQIGRAAAGAGVVLTELRPAEGAGLEEMFLQLTADDARDEVPS